MPVLRVLLVDDFGPWRRFLCSALEDFPLVQIVGEASDGLGAIQAAKGLKPDLVLLDIGLPQLNGLEVAREILKLSPVCKIIFATQESSAEIMQEALKLGAQAYILKGDAGLELLPGLEAVLQNKLFVSRSLRDESHQRNGNQLFAARFHPPVCRIY
jgi:DNA-binding NarL/FixJ family response regulator